MATVFCSKCQIVKPMTEFYDSNLTRCKDCVIARVTERRRSDPAVQAYDRMRAKRPAKKAQIAAISKAWRQKYPDRYRAQTKLNNSLRDGKVAKQPCAVCGNPKVHAHHYDYSKPLDVMWLCAIHHHRGHADGTI
jgi:hypothetical protein